MEVTAGNERFANWGHRTKLPYEETEVPAGKAIRQLRTKG